jgi:hypothetical protein
VGKPSARDQATVDQIDRLYAQLPSIACQGRCAEACGRITLTDLEARRLHRATHAAPRTILREGTHRCVYLTDRDRCRAYAVRPFLCRVWGLLKSLSCPHGCVPDRWLTDDEFVRLGAAIERLGGGRSWQTTPAGLVCHPDQQFAGLASALDSPAVRSADARAHDAEMTRGLRALFGGRIIMAVDHRRG